MIPLKERNCSVERLAISVGKENTGWFVVTIIVLILEMLEQKN